MKVNTATTCSLFLFEKQYEKILFKFCRLGINPVNL